MRTFFLILLLTSCASLLAKPMDVRWAKQLGGQQFELGYGVGTDASGNIYVTGYFHSPTLDFGSMALTNSNPNGTNANAYIAKLTPSGAVLWARSVSGVAESSSIAVDSGGNSYITGRYLSPTITIGHITLTNAGSTLPIEIFAAKFDPDGNVLWASSAGGPGNDTGFAVAADNSGNCYVTGWFRDAPAQFGSFTLQNSGSFNWFLAKYDPSGQVAWARANTGDSDTQSKGIAVDSAGNVYVTGRFSGSTSFGGLSFSVPSYDFVLVKYDQAGAVVWARNAGGSNLDYGSSVAVDAAGNPYVTGYFESSAITFGNTILTNVGGAGVPEVFTAKYDSIGNVVWARSTAGVAVDEGRHITIDRFGNACVTGLFYSRTLGTGSVILTNHHTGASSDAFLLKYDAFGNLLVGQAFGGTGNEAGRSVAADPQGDLLVAGSFTAPATFGETNLNPVGSADAFVLKLGAETLAQGPSGEADFVWARSAGGPDDENQGGIAVDEFGNVYASGHFSTSISFGPTNLTSRGDVDAYLAKYEPSGDFLWVRQIGGSSSDTSPTVLLDHSGYIYVAGYFTGTATFSGTNLTSSGAGDIYLAKYDSEGSLLWVQKAGGNGADHCINLSLDQSNCVYLGGYYRNVAAFGSETMTATPSCGVSRSDAYVAKYFPNGELAWVVSGGSCLDDVTYDVSADADAVYAVGYFRTNAIFSAVTLSHVGLQDAFVAKYNTQGALQWIRTAVGAQIDIAQHVASDGSGNVYVVGIYESNPLNFGSTNLPNAGAQDIFMAKYNAAGSLVWVRSIGSSGNDGAGALAVDGAGDLWVAGTFQSTVFFGTTNLTSKGAGDIFLARYSPDGTLVWLKAWGASGSDAASDLALRGNGEIYLSGVFSGNVMFGNDLLERVLNFFRRKVCTM